MSVHSFFRMALQEIERAIFRHFMGLGA